MRRSCSGDSAGGATATSACRALRRLIASARAWAILAFCSSVRGKSDSWAATAGGGPAAPAAAGASEGAVRCCRRLPRLDSRGFPHSSTAMAVAAGESLPAAAHWKNLLSWSAGATTSRSTGGRSASRSLAILRGKGQLAAVGLPHLPTSQLLAWRCQAAISKAAAASSWSHWVLPAGRLASRAADLDLDVALGQFAGHGLAISLWNRAAPAPRRPRASTRPKHLSHLDKMATDIMDGTRFYVSFSAF